MGDAGSGVHAHALISHVCAFLLTDYACARAYATCIPMRYVRPSSTPQEELILYSTHYDQDLLGCSTFFLNEVRRLSHCKRTLARAPGAESCNQQLWDL